MCSKNNSKKKIDKNFIEAISILKNNDINYWVCQGTLLGIIRDNELIPWDHDIDLAVWKGSISKEKIKNIMFIENFTLKKKFLDSDDQLTFVKNGGREVDFNFYEIIKNENNIRMAFVDWKVPKNKFCKLIEAISQAKSYDGNYRIFIKLFILFQPLTSIIKLFLIKKNLFYQSAGYSHPEDLVKEFTSIPFYEISITVPKKFKEYLEYIYGDQWTIPQKNFNWIKDSPSTIRRVK